MFDFNKSAAMSTFATGMGIANPTARYAKNANKNMGVVSDYYKNPQQSIVIRSRLERLE